MRRSFAVRGIKIVSFCLIFLLIFSYVSQVLTCPSDKRNYQWIAGFYEENEGSLDAVYLGSSCTYAFWQAPLAFEDYGITVLPFCSNAQPLAAAKYLIEEARKTQEDALFIIPINTMAEEYSEKTIHYLVDYFPESINKWKMIWKLTELKEDSYSERLEYYFPIIRYHSRWNQLGYDDFNYTLEGVKGGSTYTSFLENVEDVSQIYHTTSAKVELEQVNYDTLTDLLEYCKEEQVNVLFITVPQALDDEERLGRYHTANELIQSYGFPVLDLMDKVDEIGLDLTKDYYNRKHTNIHGSIKVTDYISRYLVENYSFEDKRNMPEYQDWTDAAKNYRSIIGEQN